MTKKALVLGAGGFIGSHMVKRLKSDGYWVRGVDLKRPEFSSTYADEFIQGDLREADFVRKCLEYKGTGVNSTKKFLTSMFIHLMRYISLLLTWVEQDLYSQVRMMLR